MRLISDAAVAARAGRMLNIHPSLLPEFKGLHTHEQALQAGARLHGASVHYVTPELDGGPVIAQVRVPVQADDDAARLGGRVLGREHPLLLATLRLMGSGRVALIDNRVHLDGRPLAVPLMLDEDDRLVEGTNA
jgi:phosphoribosylglycinamide formyltransferase-1